MANIAYYQNGAPYSANGEPVIVITGGPTPPTGTVPASPPPNGGLYVTMLPPNVAPIYLKDRMKVEYVPGKNRQFTPYNQITQLQKIFDQQISAARTRIPEPFSQIVDQANASLQGVINTQTGNDAQVAGAEKELKDAVKGLQDANNEVQNSDNNVAQKHDAAEKALNEVKPILGLTAVAPEDYDTFLTQVLQPVTRTYWEELSVKPRVEEFNAKQRLLAALDNMALVIQDTKSKASTLTERVKQVIAEREKAEEESKVKDAIKFTADFYKELTGKLGEQSAQVAQELAEVAKGKQIRSVDDAMKAFDKYKDVLNKKYSVQDREAIANALKSINRDEVAKSFAKFSKAFGYTGKVVDAYDIFMVELPKAVKDDNWRPFFVKVESIFAGSVATAITAFAYSIILGTPIGILGFALIIALVSAFVDEKLMEKINKLVGI